eukprot:gene17852-24239_t
MPKKSTKSKSKRLTLRAKNKVIKKVKEHHRKKRKELKKTGGEAKAPKDPGLPSQWPFKEELVKEFAFRRAKILADEQKVKDEKKARRMVSEPAWDELAGMGCWGGWLHGVYGPSRREWPTYRAPVAKQVVGRSPCLRHPAASCMLHVDRRAGKLGLDTDGNQLADVQAAALAKEADFETRKRARLTGDTTGTDKDGSRKAFYKEFRKVVDLADVVIQVLDARDPMSCRCLDVERYIRQNNPNKRIVLLLNKMDLVPREVGEKWLAYFREELPTIAFKCSTQQQATRMGQRKMVQVKPSSKRMVPAGAKEFETSACLGADTLIQLLKNYCRNTGIKTGITVGVVGLPNVGKSSLINSLKRARVAQVGNTPGVTKSLQEVHLDKNIKLLDSPGIVFTSAGEGGDAAAVLRNCIKVEKLDDVSGSLAIEPPNRAIMSCGAQTSPRRARDESPAGRDADKFLQHVAASRGKLKKGGVPHIRSAARIVLNDWNDGRIPYYTSPPSRGNEEFQEAAVMGTWAKEFDADAVFATERSAVIAHLPSMDDDGDAAATASASRSFFELASMGAATVDMKAMEQDDGDADGMEGCDMEDEEYGAAKKVKKLKVPVVPNAAELLYNEEGQVNPLAKKAQKKALKKAVAVSRLEVAEDDEGSDFEFEAVEKDVGDDEDDEDEDDEDEEGEDEDDMSD